MVRAVVGRWLAATGVGCGLAWPWLAAAAEPLALVSWPAVSPDGTQVVFGWLDDIWRVPVAGGVAERLTEHPARDSHPRVTPDGRRVLFSSDRTGTRQVFAMPAGGGEAVQLSVHSEGNTLEAVAPDGRFALVRGPRDGTGHDPERLVELRLDREAPEALLFDDGAHSASISPDGRRVLFCRGGEPIYRKGCRGPRCSRIWLHDRDAGTFTPLVCEETEARWPLWLPDGKSFLFVSGRDGTGNLWRGSVEGGGRIQLTHFEDDGVLWPTVSADGETVVFRQGFALWRLHPGGDAQPAVIPVSWEDDEPGRHLEPRRLTGTADADVAPDGDTTVFSAEGDLWVLARGQLARLTDTPEAEKDVAFLPDGSGFFFLRDDGVDANYRLARRADAARAWAAGNLTVVPATTGTAEKRRLRVSPDGGRIAWVEGNGGLVVAAADGSGAERVFSCWDPPTFDWSPDGGWLAVAAEDRNCNREILLVRADGAGAPVNLSRHPGFDGSPRWSPNGRRIAFVGRRGTPERRLFCLDLGAGGPAAAGLTDAPVRTLELPTRGVEPARLVWTADSRRVLFQSTNRANRTLYAVEAKAGGEVARLARHRGLPLRVGRDGTLHWLVDRAPATLRLEGSGAGEVVRREIPPTAVVRDRRAHSRLVFRIIWRTLGRRFYDPALNGRDWPALLAKYEPAAAASPDWRSFDRVATMLFGELNASHLTFVSEPWTAAWKAPKPATVTRHPGVRFATREDGTPVIATVLPGSPAARLTPPLTPGSAVVAVDGRPAGAGVALERLLEGKPGTAVRLAVEADGRRRDVTVPTLTWPEARRLAAAARRADARRRVRERTGGRADYIALPRMRQADFADFERRVYQAACDCDGLVLDLRDNGGGTIADHLLTVFCQPRHAVTIPRDGGPGYPQDRVVYPIFPKPLVVLINQHTFSNAEVFAHAMRHLGRAPLVGTRTAGGVISSGRDRILDAGTLRVPFRGWFHPETGADLEMNGATPDVPAELPPAAATTGQDPQLEAATANLLERLGAAGTPAFTPRYRSQQPRGSP